MPFFKVIVTNNFISTATVVIHSGKPEIDDLKGVTDNENCIFIVIVMRYEMSFSSKIFLK